MKKLIQFILILGGLTVLTSCADTTTWQEEVKLLDGRVIIVTQKHLYEGAYNGQDYGAISRDTWLTFKLPEYDDKEIVWHEKLQPLVVNVYGGKLYIVGDAPTGRESDLYGNPQPPYICFVFENKQWKRIPFAQIPSSIYDTNMLLNDPPKDNSKYVDIWVKDKERKSATMPKKYKRLDPTYQGN